MMPAASVTERAFDSEIGRIIESKRKERGISQQMLALSVGVHRNTLCRWESGERGCPLWMLLRIADVLCCNHLVLLPRREYTWGAGWGAGVRG